MQTLIDFRVFPEPASHCALSDYGYFLSSS